MNAIRRGLLGCLVAATLAAPASAGPEDDRRDLDNAELIKGLQQRGLVDLLAYYQKLHPAEDKRQALLAERQIKLQIYDDTSRDADERIAALDRSLAILRELIEAYPEDLDGLEWRLTLGFDLLYKRAEMYANNILFRGGSPDDREQLRKLATEAQQVFADLIEAVPRFRQLGNRLSVKEINELKKTGNRFFQTLRQAQPLAEYYQAWAKYYIALGMQPGAESRIKLLDEVHAYLDEKQWTEMPHSETGIQVQACQLYGMASRLKGKFADALVKLDRAVEIWGRLEPSERQSLLGPVIICKLEAVRCLRDQGKYDEALSALTAFETWSKDLGLAGNTGVQLAIAFMRSNVLDAKAEALPDKTSDAYTALKTESRKPLIDLANRMPEAKGAIYDEIWRRAKAEPPANLDAFELHAVMTGWLAQKEPGKAIPYGERLRADESELARQLRPETLFNLGVCYHETVQPLKAADCFSEMATKFRSDPNAFKAAKFAATIMSDLFADSRFRNRGDVQKGFADALASLCDGWPTSDEARYWQFFRANILEKREQWAAAARQYARVDQSHANYLNAVYSRCVCLLRHAQEIDQTNPDDKTELRRALNELIDAAKEATPVLTAGIEQARADQPGRIQEVQKDIAELKARTDMPAEERNSRMRGLEERLQEEQKRPQEIERFAADTLLIRAGALNDPPISKPQEALAVLADFEKRFGHLSDLVGQSLRIKILAYQATGRSADAAKLIDEYLKRDPTNAGPVVQGLLNRIQEEIDIARRSGKIAEAKQKSREAYALAQRLFDWAKANVAQLPGGEGDLYGFKLKLAQAALDAEQYQQAETLAKELWDEDAERNYRRMQAAHHADPDAPEPRREPVDEPTIRCYAEALYRMEKFDQAVEIFKQIHARAEHRTDLWWYAYVRLLQGGTEIYRQGKDPEEAKQFSRGVLNSIARERKLGAVPERWRAELGAVENFNRNRLAGA